MRLFLILAILFSISQNTIAQSSISNLPKAKINHTAIYVVDLEKSGQFYHDIIGLDTIPEPFHDGKHIWMQTS